jgi:hypothetical protein
MIVPLCIYSHSSLQSTMVCTLLNFVLDGNEYRIGFQIEVRGICSMVQCNATLGVLMSSCLDGAFILGDGVRELLLMWDVPNGLKKY